MSRTPYDDGRHGAANTGFTPKNRFFSASRGFEASSGDSTARSLSARTVVLVTDDERERVDDEQGKQQG